MTQKQTMINNSVHAMIGMKIYPLFVHHIKCNSLYFVSFQLTATKHPSFCSSRGAATFAIAAILTSIYRSLCEDVYICQSGQC